MVEFAALSGVALTVGNAGPEVPGDEVSSDGVLSRPALSFLADLEREFGPARRQLLVARARAPAPTRCW